MRKIRKLKGMGLDRRLFRDMLPGVGSSCPSSELFRLILGLMAATTPEDGGGKADRALSDRLWVFHARLLAFIRYRVSDEDLAQDILSETYLAYLRRNKGLEAFRDEAALRNYLMAIAANKLRDHFRRGEEKSGRRLRFGSQEELELWLEALPDAAPGHEDALAAAEEEAERKRLVAAVMAVLPERYRRILALKFTEGLGNPAIAERLGLGIKAVESLLVRAKAAFRDEFEGLSLANEGAKNGVDERKGGRR